MSCFRCGEGELERDSSGCQSVDVCTSCGCVAGTSESDLSFERTGVEHGTFVFANGVAWGGDVKTNRRQKGLHCGSVSRKEARKSSWLEELDKTAKFSGLPSEVLEVAKDFFRRAYELPAMKYRKEALVPSCIYAASRLNKGPVTIKKVSEYCYKSVPQIGRTFKLLVKELGLVLPVVKHKQIVESVCCQVKVPNVVMSDVIGTAKRLCDLLDKIEMSDNIGANLLAGVCVAITWQAKQPTKHKKIPEVRRFVSACHTHFTTFNKSYLQVKRVLVQLCRHLPWIQGEVNEHNVLVHLEKILDFQQILIGKMTQEFVKEDDETNSDNGDTRSPRWWKRRKLDSTDADCCQNASELGRYQTHGTVSFSEDDLRSELDERDISEKDMIQYIRTKNEVDRHNVQSGGEESESSDSLKGRS